MDIETFVTILIVYIATSLIIRVIVETILDWRK